VVNSELRGGSFLIVGYGREGRSVRQFIRSRFPTALIGLADRQGFSETESFDSHTKLFSGDSYLSEAAAFETVIRSPGVRIQEIAPHLGPSAHLTSATNIFFAECPGKIVGITGTKGKSTTSSLTAAILKNIFPDVRLVGNIGIPMLDYLKDADGETHFVIELSSYQLEDLKRSPHISILLNIVPEHLDYHGGFEAYCAAKLNIARNQREGDLFIINQSFSLLSDRTKNFPGRRVTFREVDEEGALVVVRNGAIFAQTLSSEPLIQVADLPIKGPGNLQNALAAISCGVILGASPNEIRKGIEGFAPLEHRLEFVAERAGIRFYNDSLSTIPEALTHALEALGGEVETVIAGGFDRGVDMASLGPALAVSKVKTLILFPTTGEKIWEAAVSAAPQREYSRVDVQTMDEAVQAAYDCTAPGRTCVLSPASSSFSVFRDYRDRGDQFKNAVRRLAPSRRAVGVAE
jgi:UDP-N-acetylmuramoylalanine--D-glutamate ligase